MQISLFSFAPMTLVVNTDSVVTVGDAGTPDFSSSRWILPAATTHPLTSFSIVFPIFFSFRSMVVAKVLFFLVQGYVVYGMIERLSTYISIPFLSYLLFLNSLRQTRFYPV